MVESTELMRVLSRIDDTADHFYKNEPVLPNEVGYEQDEHYQSNDFHKVSCVYLLGYLIVILDKVFSFFRVMERCLLSSLNKKVDHWLKEFEAHVIMEFAYSNRFDEPQKLKS